MNSKSNDPKPSGSTKVPNNTQVFILTPEMLRKMGIASQIPNLEHVTNSGQKQSKPQINIDPETTPKRKIELKQKLLEKIKRTENTNKINIKTNTKIPTDKQEISQDQLTKNVETTIQIPLNVKPDQSSIDKSINISSNRVRRQSKQLDNKIDIDESASVRKSTRKRKLSNLLDDFVTDLKIYDGSERKNCPNRRNSGIDKDIKIDTDIKIDINIDKPINKIDKTNKSLKLSNEEHCKKSIHFSENIFTHSKPLRTYSRDKKCITPNVINIKHKQISQTNIITLDAPVNSKREVSEPENLPSTIDSINSILKTESDILISQEEIIRFKPRIAETNIFKYNIFDQLYSEPTNYSFKSVVSETPTTSSNSDPVQYDFKSSTFISKLEASETSDKTNPVIDEIVPLHSDPIISDKTTSINDNTPASLISTSVVAEPTKLDPAEPSNILIVIPDRIEISELQTALENTLKYIKIGHLNKSMKMENTEDNITLIRPHKINSSLLQNAFDAISISSNVSTMVTSCELNDNTNVSTLETNINEVTNLTQSKASCEIESYELRTPKLKTNISLLQNSNKNVEESTNIVNLSQTKDAITPILETDQIDTQIELRETTVSSSQVSHQNTISTIKIDIASSQNILEETIITSQKNKATNENRPNIDNSALDTNKSSTQKETKISSPKLTNLNQIIDDENKPKIIRTLKTHQIALENPNSVTEISVASGTNKTTVDCNIEIHDAKLIDTTKKSLLQNALEKSISKENTKTQQLSLKNTYEQSNLQTLEIPKGLHIDNNNQSITNQTDPTNETDQEMNDPQESKKKIQTFDSLQVEFSKENSDKSTNTDLKTKDLSINLECELKCVNNKIDVIDNETITQNKDMNLGVSDNSIIDQSGEHENNLFVNNLNEQTDHSESDVDQNIFEDDMNIELEDSNKDSRNLTSPISLSKMSDSKLSESSRLLIKSTKLDEEIGNIGVTDAATVISSQVNTETTKVQIISKINSEGTSKDINSKNCQAIKLNPIITDEFKHSESLENISVTEEIVTIPENKNIIKIVTKENNNAEVTRHTRSNETPKLIDEITKQDIFVSEEITPRRRGRKPKKSLESTKLIKNSSNAIADSPQSRKRGLIKKEEIKMENSESEEEHRRKKVQKIDSEIKEILVKKNIGRPSKIKQTSSDNEKFIAQRTDKETPARKKSGRPRKNKHYSDEIKDSDEECSPEKDIQVNKKLGRFRRIKQISSDNEESSAKENTNEPLDSDEECKVQNSKPEEEISTKKKVGRPRRIKRSSSDNEASFVEQKTDDSQDYDEEIPVKKKVGRQRKIKHNEAYLVKQKNYEREDSDEEWKTENDDSETPVVKKVGRPRRIKRSSSDNEVSSTEQKTDDSQGSDEEMPIKKKVGRPRKIKPYNDDLVKQKTYETQDSDVEWKTEKDVSEFEQEMPIDESRNTKQSSSDTEASFTKQNIKPEFTDNDVTGKGTNSVERKLEIRMYGKGRPRKSTKQPKTPIIIKGMVTCAVCNEKLKHQSWPSHKLKHNNLAWPVGADEIDLNNTAEVTRILQKLTKTKKKLCCTECRHKSKSVVGYLSHLDQCKKSKEEIRADHIPCPICKKTMLPTSLKVHMGVSHNEKQKPREIKSIELDTIQINSPNTPVRLKREAARKAFDLIQEVSLDDDDMPKKSFLKKTYRKMSEPPKPTVFGFFWKSYTNQDSFTCKIKSCTFTTNTLKELREHTNICPELKPSDFVCSYCLFISVTEQTMITHVKTKHLKKPDYEPDEEYEDEEEEDENYECEEVPDIFVKKVRNPLTNKKFTYKVAFLAKEKRMLLSVICTYPAAARWTKEFYENNYLQHLFKDMKLFKDDYIQLSNKEQIKYLPQLKQSMAVKELTVANTVPNLQGHEHIWKHYGLYETTVNNDVITMFCGGPIWALAWAPTPFTKISDQILGVSVQKSTLQNYKIGQSYAGEESIQFWNFGPLDHKKLMIDHPKLEFTLTHTHGMVWHMEWCPSGCYEDSGSNFEDSCKSEHSDLLNRLGLLALACSDGNIIIYAIPLPFSNSQQFYKTKEKYRLITQNSTEIKLGLWEYQVTKLSWSKSKGHNYIAGGYSNGLVSLWNLETKSPLLKFNDEGTIVLKPYLTFQAHVSAISAIVLHPLDGGKRWLFTGSWDKSSKYWDLNNISTTISSYKRGLTTDGVWMTHWLTSFVTYDDVFNLSHTVTTAQNVRDYYYKQSSAMACNSMVNAISGNDWANAIAQVSIAGQLLGSFPRQMLVSFDEKGMKCKRVLFGYTELIDKTLQPKERIIKIEKTSKKKALDFSDKDDKYIFQYLMNKDENKFEEEPDTYEEAQQKYGMIFCDINLLKFEKVPKETQNWVRQSNRMSHAPLELYPLMSINRVAWNPNLQSYLYLGTGYQTGFVRVKCVRFMHTKYTEINV